MYQITFIFLFISTILFSREHALVSIAPVKTFVEAIAGDKLTVEVMVKAGSSPHTYEPKPSQMLLVSKASLYFAIGVEFEHLWLPKFRDINPKLQVIDLAKGIEKIAMSVGHEEREHQHDAHLDPHIWTDPGNVSIIAKSIYQRLITLDPSHQAYYQKNLKRFLGLIQKTHQAIETQLSTLGESRSFMVFHPSWGYFARAYHLKQIAVEVEGKSPKPKALISLIKEARASKVRAIFTQPEFSDKAAQIIAQELAIPVRKVTPLASDWAENLSRIAQAIATKQKR